MSGDLVSRLARLSPGERRELLRRVRDRHSGSPSGGGIGRVERGEGVALPASYAQERLWFLWRLAPTSTAYHIPWCYEITGNLDTNRLATALTTLTQRHEILRTTLHEHHGQVTQTIHPPTPHTLTPQSAHPDDIPHLTAQATTQPFDLTTGPLLRTHLWHTAPHQHTLLFTAHHITLDEWSLLTLQRELWTLYTNPTALPPPDLHYADYATWQRELVERHGKASLDHWRRELEGAPASGLVPDRPRPAVASFSGSQRVAVVSSEGMAWLEGVRGESGATDFMILLAVYGLLLARHSGQRDLTIGTPVSGRTHADTAGLIGLFVNTLALRIHIHPHDTFRTLLHRIRTTTLNAFHHQETPFDHVVRAAAPHRDPARNPLFQTMFSFTPGLVAEELAGVLPDDLALREVELPSAGSHFDLSLGVTQTGEGFAFCFDYSTELFDSGTVDHLADSLTDLLHTVGANPDTPVEPLFRPTSRERDLLDDWNADGGEGEGGRPRTPVHELLREQVRRTPDAIAVDTGALTLTYAQLDTATDALAHRLRQNGVHRGDTIGVLLRPGPLAITAVWATWKAGAAFLPLDPDIPQARLTTMLDDAAPVLMIAGDTDPVAPRIPLLRLVRDDLATLAGSSGRAGRADSADLTGAGGAQGGQPRAHAVELRQDLPGVGAGDLAYVMYTSGSTGRPKGVMIEHGNLTAHALTQLLPRLDSIGRDAGRPLRIVSGTSAFISDFFLDQILPLLGGHTLVTLTPDQRRDPRFLIRLGSDPHRAIDVLDCTTSQLHLLTDAGLLTTPHPPHAVIFGGETCPPDLWTTLRNHPTTTAYNTYGPTETTVDVTCLAVSQSDLPLIGRPYGGARIVILDDALNPVPPGVIGEICIGGTGVGRGYLHRPDLTAATFIPDPTGQPGTRLYRTGDQGRYRHDGTLEFWGRTDHQIKILGQRIELEEIEATLRTHPHITNAAVTAHPLAADGAPARLIAHVVPRGDHQPDPAEVREFLAGLLPPAMVPTHIHHTDALPLTATGKLDRTQLTHTHPPTDHHHTPATTPHTPTQQRIATIWTDTLDLPHTPDLHDDFFTLGGHSLLAIRLVGRISADFGVDFPFHRLLSAPTVAAQADYLDGALRESEGSTVVDLGGVVGGAPLVLVHPLGGTLFCYRELLGEVTAAYDVLGLQGDLSGAAEAVDLGALADVYARQLLPSLDGRSPVVAGWSAGGVIAHALACRLEQLGVEVVRLVIIDAEPGPEPGPEPEPRRTPGLDGPAGAPACGSEPDDAAVLDRLLEQVAQAGPERLLAEPGVDRLLAVLGVDREGLVGLDGPTTARLMGFWRDMLRGLAGHRPDRFGGSAHLVASGSGDEKPDGASEDDAESGAAVAGWRALTGELVVTHVRADHLELLQRPWVTAVAEAFRSSAEETGV